MVQSIQSLGLHGVNGYRVAAECDLSGGLPAFTVVGLPDEICGELPWAAAVCAPAVLERAMEGLCALLAKNELPEGIMRLDALPMTPSGKPDKQAVKELIRQWRKV